jgi:Tfp pilus assembly protein PilO
MKNYNEILKAIGPLVIVLFLGFFVGQFTLSKVGEQSIKIKKLQKENTVLTQKVKLLSSVATNVQDGANLVTITLPESNSSLAVVSQIKLTALENELVIGNLKSGAEVKDSSGLSRADISFEIDGAKTKIIDYLNSLTKVAPIIVVDKVKLSETENGARASVTVKAFWTALPKTLPSINQSINDLTEKEIQVLDDIGTLRQPQFVGSSVETSGEGKVDPFSQ